MLAFVELNWLEKRGLLFPLLESIFEKGKKVTLQSKAVLPLVLFGVITGFLLIGSDKFYFQNQIPQLGETEPQFSLLGWSQVYYMVVYLKKFF